MAIPAIVAIVPIGVLLVLSGLIVNLMQMVFSILVRPVSKSMYRKINKVVAELLWLELIWLIDWWAGIKRKHDHFYVTLLTLRALSIPVFNECTWVLDFNQGLTTVGTSATGKERALLISNHKSDIDWLVGWLVAQRSGCLGSTLAIMKKEIMFIPFIGWSMWFSEYVFLERQWTKDENTLKSCFRRLEDFPVPFWLALFVEGTRFTQAKLMVAQEFAASRGLPIPRNVLLPRTKGFVSLVSNMRSFVPAIYDCTVAVPNNQPPPTLLKILRRQSSVVKLQIRRHSMRELPETADGIGQWCKDVFVTKDALLEKYFAKGSFSDQQLQNIGRPIKSLIVVVFWSILLACGIYKFVQWSALLTSWQGIAFSATFLVLIGIIMQILILSSESERYTPLTVPPKDPA